MLKEAVAIGINYEQYIQTLRDLLAAGKSSPSDSDMVKPEMIEYTKLNLHRMERLDKTIQLSETMLATIAALSKKVYFLVISEGWCGDAAHNVPVIAKMAAASNGNIDLKIVFRDSNLPLIDAYLTNGGRAIPKLIVLDENYQELAVWGARPANAQAAVVQFKAENPTAPHEELAKLIQTWYNQDKAMSLQQEFETLIKGLH